ncbi:uncharacterized protein M6B38_321415 [Iris pallida]|uniref:Uncharacterized protein n=1 Tax=Iris pallida TaxID=29817 RepID=A0AAX6FFD0_IRIPA|nr:uncharacterized protein M6B38_135530 [Iris pallida]KAJ6838336.1 uncharacterized protein M6B38_321415 [Iris pallida]
MKLQRGRRGNCSRNSKVDEVSGTSLVDPSEETANVGRGRRERGKANSVWKQDQVADMVVIQHEIVAQDKIVDPVPVEDVVEAPKKLTRGRRGHSSRVLKTNATMDIRTMETVAVESSKSRESLARERRGILATVSQKGEAVIPVVEVSTDVPKRGRRGNSSRVSKTNEAMDIQTTDTFVADSSQAQESSRRERRGILAKVSQKGDALVPAVEGSIDVPKNLGRGKRSTRTQTLKEDEVLNSVAEENIERPKTLRRGRSSSNKGLKKEGVLDLAPDSSTQVPKNVGRTRRTGSNKVLKDDGDLAPDSSTQVPKNVGRTRRTGLNKVLKDDGDLAPDSSTQVPENVGRTRRTGLNKVLKDDGVSDSIVEGSVKVPQGLNRGSRIASSQVSKKNETLDSVMEDRTEDPVNLGRGKKRACSSRVSKKDNMVDSVEESILVPEVQEGRPRRAPARRTRAASARLSTKELLESAPLNLKGPLNPVENIYHHKELTGHSNKLGQSDKIPNVSLTASSPKEFNRSQHREEFNKENHSLVKSQRRENKGPSSGGVANGVEPSHVSLTVWNGNGIPNTTSKYKEDSKVSFHATPFEERLEKALSGDKLIPQRS